MDFQSPLCHFLAVKSWTNNLASKCYRIVLNMHTTTTVKQQTNKNRNMMTYHTTKKNRNVMTYQAGMQ